MIALYLYSGTLNNNKNLITVMNRQKLARNDLIHSSIY